MRDIRSGSAGPDNWGGRLGWLLSLPAQVLGRRILKSVSGEPGALAQLDGRDPRRSTALTSHRRRGPFGEEVADAADFGAHGLQLLLDILVAAVDVIHAVDDGFAVSHQGSEDERG